MSKTKLFNEKITDWDSWSGIIESKEQPIMPLLKYIYEINNIKLENTAFVKYGFGGCSVYRAGDTIIKIFCPPEIKSPWGVLYSTELEGMKFCKNLGVLAPEIICNGTIHDGPYSFSYIVMNYIDGIRADKIIDGYSKSEKIDFALKVKEIANKIHIPTDINIPRYDDPCNINHELWNNMPKLFREDRKRYLSTVKLPELVYTHGDFGGGNIIIDKQGRLNLIDFAESLIAPYYFDGCASDDPVIMEAYYGDYKNDEFYENQIISRLIGWFNPISIKWHAEELGIDFASITSVDKLRNMIIKRINKGDS